MNGRAIRTGLMLAGYILAVHGAISDEPAAKPAEPRMAARGLTWQDFGIGGGGAFMRIAIDPSDPNTLFTGADCGGLYKTTDRGKHWRHAMRGITKYTTGCQVESIAPDPRGNGVVYVGMEGNGLFRSDNKGETWKLLKTPRQTHSFACLEFDPDNPDVIYAGHGTMYGSLSYEYAKGVIACSRDRGETWSLITNGLDSRACFLSLGVDPFSPREKRTLYAASNLGMYRSLDGGATWQLHNGNLPVTNLCRLAFFADKKSKRLTVYLATQERKLEANTGGAARSRGGIFRSDDGGATWREINGGLPPNDFIMYSIKVSRKSPDVAWVGLYNSSGVFGTRDGGKTWLRLFRLGENVEVRSLKEVQYINQWGDNVFDIVADPSDENRIYMCDEGDIYGTQDGGETWATLSSDEVRPGWYTSRGLQQSFFDRMAISPHRPQTMLVSDDDLNMIKSEDGGVSWGLRYHRARPGQELYGVWRKYGALGEQCAGAMLFDPDVPGVVYASGACYDLARLQTQWGNNSGRRDRAGMMMKSWDDGDHWMAITPDNGLPLGSVWGNAIAVDRRSPPERRTVYAAIFGKGIYRTDDGGLNWRACTDGLPGVPGMKASIFTTSVAMHAGTSNTLYCGLCPVPGVGANVLGGVYRSDDGGKSWRKANQNIELPRVYTLDTDPRNGQRLYAVTWSHPDPKLAKQYPGGLYLSEDGGATWTLSLARGGLHTVVFNPELPRIAYAVGRELGGAVFRTLDGGTSWEDIGGDLDRVPPMVRTIALSPEDPSRLFIGLTGPGGYTARDEEAAALMKRELGENVLANGSFEALDDAGLPLGWTLHAPPVNGKAVVQFADSGAHDGKRCLRVDLTALTTNDLAQAAPDSGCYLTQNLSAYQLAQIRGKKVRFSGRVRFNKPLEQLNVCTLMFFMDICRHGEENLAFETYPTSFFLSGREGAAAKGEQPYPVSLSKALPAAVAQENVGRYLECAVTADIPADVGKAFLSAWLVESVSADLTRLSADVDDLRLTVVGEAKKMPQRR